MGGIGTHPYLVHYILPEGPSRGYCRPAVVVNDRTGVAYNDHPETCNLIAFADGNNDGLGDDYVLWPTSVHHTKDGADGTWHTHTECATASAARAQATETGTLRSVRQFLEDAERHVEAAVTGENPAANLPPPGSLTLNSVTWPTPDHPLATFQAALPSGADEIWFYHAFGDPYAPDLRLIAKSPTGTVTIGEAPFLLTPGGPYTIAAFSAKDGFRAPVPLSEQFEIPAYEAPNRFPEPLAWAQGQIEEDALVVSILVGPPGGQTQQVRFKHTKDPDIADTGAFMLTIDAQTAQALGLPNLGAADVSGVGGAASGYYTKVDVEFPGNGHRDNNVNAVVIDGFGECLIGLRYAVDRHLIVAIDTVRATLSYYQAA